MGKNETDFIIAVTHKSNDDMVIAGGREMGFLDLPCGM